jgi:hypothetical protein
METKMSDWVSFTEAIEAYKQGNTIYSYLDGEQADYSPTSKYADTISIGIREITHGQWKIEWRQ